MACLRWLFHQGVQLGANLVDPLSQLLMLRPVRRGVTLLSEVMPIVRCDFCKLPLEGFNSVGEVYVIHDGNRMLSLLRQQHIAPCCSPKEYAPHSRQPLSSHKPPYSLVTWASYLTRPIIILEFPTASSAIASWIVRLQSSGVLFCRSDRPQWNVGA
jgi:hypothetical protein